MVTTFLIGDGAAASLATLLASANAATERNAMAGYNTGNLTASLGFGREP